MKRLAILLASAALLGSCAGGPGAGPATPQAGDGDWPQWGRDGSKNMVSGEKNLPFSFDPGQVKPDGTVESSPDLLWAVKLGSQTYGNPTVSNGRIFVGTNNEGRGDPRFKGDYSVVHCFEAATGKTLWSLTVPKLGSGKVGDWEFLGICSSPTVVGDRVYIVTNRCEIMCLDVQGLANGNQGLQDEGAYMAFQGTTPMPPVEVKPTDADILWRYDMREELAIFQHNIAGSSILPVGDLLFCSTSNGVTYDHTEIPRPKAPALIALDRKLAEKGAPPADILVGEEGSGLSKRIFHGVWTSPCWGDGQLLFGGPDGVMYSFDPKPVKDSDGFGVFPLKWSYDCNPPEYRWRDGDKSQPIKYASLGEGPSEILSTPVFYKGRVYAPIGQDPEHRGGPGNMTCLDAATGKKVWELRINRSLSTCSVADDKVYISDFDGWLYCIDANDGKLQWKHRTGGEIWCSTLVADGKVYLGNAKGTLSVFSIPAMNALVNELGAGIEVAEEKSKVSLLKDGNAVRTLAAADAAKVYRAVQFGDPIHCTPVVAQGVLYVATMRHLYAVKGAK